MLWGFYTLVASLQPKVQALPAPLRAPFVSRCLGHVGTSGSIHPRSLARLALLYHHHAHLSLARVPNHLHVLP